MCTTAQMCASAEAAVREAHAAGKTCDEAANDAIAAAEKHEPEMVTDAFRNLLRAHAAQVYKSIAITLHGTAH